MGVSVPNGFATTADAFNQFLDQSGVNQRIYALLDETDIDDVSALAKAGAQIRQWIIDTPSRANWKTRFVMLMTCCPPMTPRPHSPCALPPPRKICRTPPSPGSKRHSSTCRALTPCSLPWHVFASLFNDRAISYRVHQGYDHRGVALSAGVQRMVRSDLASSGVMFSIDTESGFDGGVYHLCMGFGRDGGAGRGEPGRILRPQTDAGRWPSGDRAPHHGVEKIRMVYAPTGSTVNRCVSKMCRRRSAIFSR